MMRALNRARVLRAAGEQGAGTDPHTADAETWPSAAPTEADLCGQGFVLPWDMQVRGLRCTASANNA
jgi:hypothetical protein